MITIAWYEKGQPKQRRQFATMREAQAFALALNSNPNVECYNIER